MPLRLPDAPLRRLFLWLTAVAVSLFLTACGTSGPTRSIDDPGNSLVFGYIDMADAPTSADSAWLQQIAPPSDTPFWGLSVVDGIFYSAYVPVGTYQVSEFQGSGFFAGQNKYSFPRQGNSTTVKIDKPGIYFLGAFKYKPEKSGFFEPGKFSLERTATPTQKALLEKILKEDPKFAATVWGEKIRRYVAKLK